MYYYQVIKDVGDIPTTSGIFEVAMLVKLFKTLGISENEGVVYTSLAEMGKAPATVLSKATGIPRSTVYTALEALQRRGLVSVERLNDTSFYLANQPTALLRMIEDERTAFSKDSHAREESAHQLIPLLTPYFQNRNYSIPTLRFFEGTANVRTMLYDYQSLWQDDIAKYDYTWWGYQDHYFVEHYKDWLECYWRVMRPQEQIKLLSNPSSVERKLKDKVARRTIRSTPKKAGEFSSTIWILGDYVVTIMTRQQPHYAMMLHDTVFAANQRILFQMLWNDAP